MMNEAMNLRRCKRNFTAAKCADKLSVGMLLTLAGGFLESYSYLTRGGVFANCQSGNIVLSAMHVFQGNWLQALKYFTSIFAFALGVLLSELIRDRASALGRVKWQHIALAIEALLIFAVGLMPQGDLDTAATLLIAFVCAIQLCAFRQADAASYATTMCTGNLKSGMLSLYAHIRHSDPAAAAQVKTYFTVILMFMLGAVIGMVCVWLTGARAAWVCSLILLCAVRRV